MWAWHGSLANEDKGQKRLDRKKAVLLGEKIHFFRRHLVQEMQDYRAAFCGLQGSLSIDLLNLKPYQKN